MKDLIIHQQRVLIYTARKYQQFQEKLSGQLLEERKSDRQQSMTDDQYLEFLRYQHRSLGKYYFSKSLSDTELTVDVFAVSNTHMNDLFQRWTEIPVPGANGFNTSPVKGSFNIRDLTQEERKSWKVPLSVETGEGLGGSKPDTVTNFMSSFADTPKSISPINPLTKERTGSDTQSQPIFRLQSPSAVNTPLDIPRPSSPQSSDSELSPTSIPNFGRKPSKPPESVASSRVSNADSLQQDDESIIRWRIKLDESRWEFDNEIMIRTNTAMPFRGIVNRSGTVTEIRRNKISRDALDEAGYRYDKISFEDNSEWGKGGGPRIREFWQIYGGLVYDQMAALIRRTKEIDEERERNGRRREDRRSSLRSYGRTPLRSSTSDRTRRSSHSRPRSTYVEPAEEREERKREKDEKRSRPASFTPHEDTTQYATSSRKFDHYNRNSTSRTQEKYNDKKERRGFKSSSANKENLSRDDKRERDDEYRYKDRGKDSIPIIGASLLTLLGLSM
jgi:hypothetical protein